MNVDFASMFHDSGLLTPGSYFVSSAHINTYNSQTIPLSLDDYSTYTCRTTNEDKTVYGGSMYGVDVGFTAIRTN